MKFMVRAEWQPAYMDSPTPRKEVMVDTIEKAEHQAKLFNRTAWRVEILEVKPIKKYLWGKETKR